MQRNDCKRRRNYDNKCQMVEKRKELLIMLDNATYALLRKNSESFYFVNYVNYFIEKKKKKNKYNTKLRVHALNNN